MNSFKVTDFIAGCPWEHVFDYVTVQGVLVFIHAYVTDNTVCLERVTKRRGER